MESGARGIGGAAGLGFGCRDRPARSGACGPERGRADWSSLVLRAATGHHTVVSKQAGTEDSWQRTSVDVSLLGEFVVRVAVGVDGLVQLLKRHESMHELVVGMEKAAEPLLALHKVNLGYDVSAKDSRSCGTRQSSSSAEGSRSSKRT